MACRFRTSRDSGFREAANGSLERRGGNLADSAVRSACTCPADANEHPGPNVKVGRGAPEIDILEAQTFYTKRHLVGAVSQSAQFAPYDADYQIRNTTPWTVVQTPDRTVLNSYQVCHLQHAPLALVRC